MIALVFSPKQPLCTILHTTVGTIQMINFTVATSGAGAGVGKSMGKITSDSVGKLIDHYGKSKQHNKSKITEHLLQGFQHDDTKWIMFLLDAFSEIFIW